MLQLAKVVPSDSALSLGSHPIWKSRREAKVKLTIVAVVLVVVDAEVWIVIDLDGMRASEL